MTILISMFLKPFIIGAFISGYHLLIEMMWKYLPYKISSFLLKNR